MAERLKDEKLKAEVANCCHGLGVFAIPDGEVGPRRCGRILPAPCHLPRQLPWAAQPASRRRTACGCLRAVEGIDLVEIENLEQCCGFGGTFAIKNAEVSSAMLSEKVRGVLNTRRRSSTGCDNSCLMHIGGALHRQSTGVHPSISPRSWPAKKAVQP